MKRISSLTVSWLILLAYPAFSDPPFVLQIQRSGNDIVVNFPSAPQNYYILRTGVEPTTATGAIEMALGTGVTGSLMDAGILQERPARGFYRLEAVPRSAPLDTDQDTMHDVWELEYDFLDPFDPDDATLDFDQDGFSNSDELIHFRTDPGADNATILPPRLVGLSLQAAKHTLEAAGLTLGTITFSQSDHTPAVVVLPPDVPQNVGLPEGAAINVLVSLPYDPNRFIDQRNFPDGTDGSEANSQAYYNAIDPTGSRTTLAAWKAANGFGQAGGEEAFAAYFNEADLGFGRRMFMRRDPQRIAYYVVNYQTADQATLGLTDDLATVAMEYSPHLLNGGDSYVKFFIFNGHAENRVDPTAPPEARLTKIDLDGRGLKFQPGMCMTCHGGTPRELVGGIYPNQGRTDARFIPFDLESFTYSELPGFSRAEQELAFKKLNEGVLASIPPRRFTFTYEGGFPIPDNNSFGVVIPLVVNNIQGTIGDLDFSFDGFGPASNDPNDRNNGLSHAYIGDVVATLKSPAGTTITLIDRIGLPGSDPNFGLNAQNFCNMRLDDEASTPLENAVAAQAPFTGSWLPAQALSAFDGENPVGTWYLNISDNAPNDLGALSQWSLRITTAAPSDAVVKLIEGWYDGSGLPGTFDPFYLPPEWDIPEAGTLYQDVIAKSCRACHVMLSERIPDLDFSSYAPFSQPINLIRLRARVFTETPKPMPMAKRTFEKFWKSVDPAQAEALAEWLDSAYRFKSANPSPIFDPGQGPVTVQTLTVSNGPEFIEDLDFSFDGNGPGSRNINDFNNGLTHTHVSDLVATLTSPQGTSVVLLNRQGGSGNNFFRTRFDDEVEVSLNGTTNLQGPYTGSWIPAEPLSAFDDENANGVWTLAIQDFAAGDSGWVLQWSLHFNSLGATVGPRTPQP